MKPINKGGGAFLLVILAALTPLESRADSWDWTVAPYIWASDVGLDVAVNNDPVLGTDIPFTDLLDTVEAAFMGHFEGRGQKFGVLADAIYLDAGDQTTVTVGPGGPISGDLAIDVDLTLGLYELGGIYRVGDAESGKPRFDILFGARIVDVDQTVNITLPGPAGTEVSTNIDVSETDAFLGGRVLGRFNTRWGYTVRVDISRGGTEGTLNALAAVDYSFGQSGLFALDMGYRYMSIELSDDSGGTSVDTEIEITGPFVGFVFNF